MREAEGDGPGRHLREPSAVDVAPATNDAAGVNREG
jgi:hypothetical protein